ncbi:hypothetical protein AX16_006534 [Volvariella volvacea WC 439]|nr:hypothetical protein AX16_006534 [Volvariella volvacea WC 439]
MGKRKSKKPSQKIPPQAASKTNIRPAGLPTDDRSLTLTEQPNTSKDRLIVIQMVDGHPRLALISRQSLITPLRSSVQVPSTSADSDPPFILEIPKDSEKLTSFDANATFYAQIPVAPKDNQYPMHPSILGYPAVLSTPLLDRAHGGAATLPAPQPSPTSQLTEDS